MLEKSNTSSVWRNPVNQLFTFDPALKNEVIGTDDFQVTF